MLDRVREHSFQARLHEGGAAGGPEDPASDVAVDQVTARVLVCDDRRGRAEAAEQ